MGLYLFSLFRACAFLIRTGIANGAVAGRPLCNGENVQQRYFKKIEMTKQDGYDFLVVGGGSGGVAAARRAAGYGATVGLIEGSRMGGTCVNVGCVPKKVMYNAVTIANSLDDADHYGFTISDTKFNWLDLKTQRDAYVSRLNANYNKMLETSKVDIIRGDATFIDARTVRVGDKEFSAKHILIAVGSRPSLPSELKGVQHCISSDGFFALDDLPGSVAVVGGGYIGVELASVLNGLGAKTHIYTIWNNLLSDSFDELVVNILEGEMHRQGIKHVANVEICEVVKDERSGKLSLKMRDGTLHGPFDKVILATGRKPNTESLSLEAAGITTLAGGIGERGHIVVDDFQNTIMPGIHAVGDVCGKVELTPMAIAAGRRLADR